MSRGIKRVTHTGYTIDLREHAKRLGGRRASVAPIWLPSDGYDPDVFTITGPSDTDHVLTYLPLGLNQVTLNGNQTLEYNVDFTIDYATGVVSLITPVVAGNWLTVWYVTTGELIAATLPADTGDTVVVDTFTGTDGTALGLTSDGNATWTDRSGSAAGPLKIFGNKARLDPADGGNRIATIPGADNGTVQVTAPDVTTANRGGGVVFRYQDGSNYWGAKVLNGTLTVAHVGGAGAVYTGAGADGDVIAVEFDTAGFIVYRNGVNVYSRSDTALNASTDVGIDVFNGAFGGGSVDNFSWTTPA